MIPFPHKKVQLLGMPRHWNPFYIVQFQAQPSPSIKLLSSHAYIPIIMPSPHIGEQTLGDEERQLKYNYNLQISEHPSLFTVLLSSHAYAPDTTIPSPQIV